MPPGLWSVASCTHPAFVPRPVLPARAADHTVKVWDVSTQTCQHTLTHHTGKVQAVVWNPAEAPVLLSGGFDKRACLVSADVRAGGRTDGRTGGRAGGRAGIQWMVSPSVCWQSSLHSALAAFITAAVLPFCVLTTARLTDPPVTRLPCPACLPARASSAAGRASARHRQRADLAGQRRRGGPGLGPPQPHPICGQLRGRRGGGLRCTHGGSVCGSLCSAGMGALRVCPALPNCPPSPPNPTACFSRRAPVARRFSAWAHTTRRPAPSASAPRCGASWPPRPLTKR